MICPLHTFFSKHLVYPVGYLAIHTLKGSCSMSLTCRIEKGNLSDPVFVIEGTGIKVQSNTPSGAWEKVMRIMGIKGEVNGVEAFGLSIPEVAIAISEWHPACKGYAMNLIGNETNSGIDSTVNSSIMNPIFFGFTQDQELCCDVCGLPAIMQEPLTNITVCDIDNCVQNLLEKGSTEVSMKELCVHTTCSQMELRRVQENIKGAKRELMK